MRYRCHTLMTLLLSGLIYSTTLCAENLPPGIIAVNPPRPAPDLLLSDDSGKQFDLRRSRGKWVFVHFWASWCGPCKREMPLLQTLIQSFKATNFELVVINTAETDDTIFSFLSETAPELSSLMDSDGQVTEAWAPRGLPASYLVDPAGNIRYMALGGRPWNTSEYQAFLHHVINQQ